MPVDVKDVLKARVSLDHFRVNAASPFHERYSFPFFSGSYFAYRKVDVLRVVAITKAAAAATNNNNPSYLDVGCGYGDFLKRVREFLPSAKGIEKNADIFYRCGVEKPEYIEISDASWGGIDRKYDTIFVGWMEPGQDFRDPVAEHTDVIVTTLDQGISLAAEFDGHGFDRIASWITPSWEDVNTEIMNRYYTKVPEHTLQHLSRLRGAHNLWHVYAKQGSTDRIKKAIQDQVEKEKKSLLTHYEFELVLDECGFGFMQRLENPTGGVADPLWHIRL